MTSEQRFTEILEQLAAIERDVPGVLGCMKSLACDAQLAVAVENILLRIKIHAIGHGGKGTKRIETRA